MRNKDSSQILYHIISNGQNLTSVNKKVNAWQVSDPARMRD